MPAIYRKYETSLPFQLLDALKRTLTTQVINVEFRKEGREFILLAKLPGGELGQQPLVVTRTLRVVIIMLLLRGKGYRFFASLKILEIYALLVF